MKPASSDIIKYGLNWPSKDYYDDALIERYMLQQGGRWIQDGKLIGNGLEYHFKQYWSALWPDDSQTKWTDLILHEVIQNQFTSIVGPASSWKSSTIARIAMMDWSLFPECTTVIVSSTDMEGLRNKIYADLSKIWNLAHELYEWFPGHPIDYKCVITNEEVDGDTARDIRNSIVGVPCRTSTGRFVGMSKYSGRKNRRVWCIGDEYQFMQRSILDAQNNLVSNGPNLVPGIIRDPDSRENGMPIRGYKAVFIGNTNPTQPDNPLNIVSEPENGWSAIPEDGKTKVWDCKKLHDHPVKCRCICMDALDSPNADYPIDKPKWPQLAGPHKLALYTEGSESYWSQGRGPFKFGLAAFKIITKELCEQFHGFDKPIWSGKETAKIGMLDAAYGGMGGDRCMLGWLEFGECDDGITRICFKEYWTVPVVIRKDFLPEDQIAVFCKEKMEPNGVQPDNFFFDGRGSMAISLARMWSPRVNSIEFGGRPTDRLAGPDIVFIDPKTGHRRPKLAYEHFSKFVSELWWSWHYAVESDQIRGLTMAMVMDASPREYKRVANDKIEVETKKEMKKRTGVSPDIADMVVTGIEGARRRGFEIRKFHSGLTDGEDGFNWLDDWRKSHESLIRSKQLQYK